MGLTRRWAGIGAAILVAALGAAGCSALTSFGDLAFDDEDGAVGRDGRVPVPDGAAEAQVPDGGPDASPRDGEPPPRDAGPDAPLPDGEPPPRDLGPDALDGGPPPMDGDVPPMDLGPPPVDTGPIEVGPPPADTAAVECRSNADCDDFEPCTTDSCEMASGNCINSRVSLTICDDGNECTQADTCRSGVCVGTVVPCEPAGPCVASFCDPMFGCLDEDVPAGVSCDDGNACSTSSTCDGAGNCAGAADCPSDGNPCDVEVCSDLACDSVPVLNGTACPSGHCCDGACVSVLTDERNCGSCGMTCMLSGQSCVMGICSTCGSDSACNDGLSCTTDRCAGTCSNTLTTGCLINGACVGSGVENPDNQCEACRPAISATSWSPKDESASCNDGLFCTTNDHCVSGQCEGIGDPCSDMTGGCFEWRCNETLDRCERLGGCAPGFACCDDSYCALGGLCF